MKIYVDTCDLSFEACESCSGFITNDYQSKISFLSTRLAIDPNVSSLMKQAAVRSLSCEVVPGKEGQIYFGDSARGHILSNTFFLKDAQARGFHRWYSVIVFMKDKHFLLNSWPFFEKHINQMIVKLQKKALQVYYYEQNLCSQRMLRLSNGDQKKSTARSLIKLTASTVFSQLHVWFTWLLSVGAKRLQEHVPKRILNDQVLTQGAGMDHGEYSIAYREEIVRHLRNLRNIFGSSNFQKLVYSTLVGRQVIVRGPRILVKLIISLLRPFLPIHKFRCIEFGDTYKPRDVCNILGLSMFAAVPKSSDVLMRLDIIPRLEETKSNETERLIDVMDAYKDYNFVVKNEGDLPDKLPSLQVKIDNALADKSLSHRVVWFHIVSLLEQWFHTADIVRESRRNASHLCLMTLLKTLGVQEQDEELIDYWTC